MKLSTLFLSVMIISLVNAACESPPPVLPEGKWTGNLIPMDHPEIRSNLYYRVSYAGDQLGILVGMAETDSREARDVVLTSDSLHFVFDEPEADVPLRCAFGLQTNGTYEGLCTDVTGKSAYFTMRPPDPDVGEEA